jgi:hypothetical protein
VDPVYHWGIERVKRGGDEKGEELWWVAALSGRNGRSDRPGTGTGRGTGTEP